MDKPIDLPEKPPVDVDNNEISMNATRPAVLGDMSKVTYVGLGNTYVKPAKPRAPNVVQRFTRSLRNRLDAIWNRPDNSIPAYVPNFEKTRPETPNEIRDLFDETTSPIFSPTAVPSAPSIILSSVEKAKSSLSYGELDSIPEEEEKLCDVLNNLESFPLYRNLRPQSCPALRLHTIPEGNEEE